MSTRPLSPLSPLGLQHARAPFCSTVAAHLPPLRPSCALAQLSPEHPPHTHTQKKRYVGPRTAAGIGAWVAGTAQILNHVQAPMLPGSPAPPNGAGGGWPAGPPVPLPPGASAGEPDHVAARVPAAAAAPDPSAVPAEASVSFFNLCDDVVAPPPPPPPTTPPCSSPSGFVAGASPSCI